ncbi:MAG: ribulose-phosphate 3-epimerase, partial [Symbiobacteriaceae bacterium]|nr:ribulose-phosphate 3-epimerase [Symbiobacteriaceae bacterium]
MLIAPSLLAANIGKLQQEAQQVCAAGADWLHVDIMDGNFVPNISMGAKVVEMLKKSQLGVPIDVHLMVTEPEWYLASCLEAGADYITVHWEACKHLHRVLQVIKSSKYKCLSGVALNPHTPV